MHSPDHSTKGTPSALSGATPQWPLTAGEYVVSGSLSSPLRGAFHLSLTVLVRYRSLKVLSLGGWSPLLPTNSPGFVVLRYPAGREDALLYGTLTRCGDAFQRLRVSISWRLLPDPTTPTVPKNSRFGLVPPRSPLLRESRLISSRRATEMFQFAGLPLPGLFDSTRSDWA